MQQAKLPSIYLRLKMPQQLELRRGCGEGVMNCSSMGRHGSAKEVMNGMNHLEGRNLAPYVMRQYVESMSHPLG